MKPFTKILTTGVVVLAIIGGGVYVQNRAAKASDPVVEQQAPQATPVVTQSVSVQTVQIWNQYSARLAAVEYADIRPQVSGTITKVKFKDGQHVEEGDVLFIIDPRPYEAAVHQAEAELNVAKNESFFTHKELVRARELIKTNAISKRSFDERSSAHKVAVSSVLAAEARLNRARIDLDYAFVKAPISGRLSRAEIERGNLVEAGSSAPVLTSIVSTDGIYADFEVDEQTYLKYIRSSARDRASENVIPVKLIIEGDNVEYDGFIDSFDNQIDVSSGTIRARALFENADGALLPGMFASVKMGTPYNNDNILISEAAIGTDQDKKFVYVVNAESIAEYREVRLGKSVKGQRVIHSGLAEGDVVITEGIIRIRPGMPVSAKTRLKVSQVTPE